MSQVIAVTEIGKERSRDRSSLVSVSLAAAFVVVVALLATAGQLIAPRDPQAQNLLIGLSKPTGTFWLGTDDLGRDVLSRTIVGARTAVIGPILIALGALLISSALGLVAGYKGGWVDSLTMRGVDFVYALPALLVAIVIAGVLGSSYFITVGLLIVLFAPYDTRIIRAATLEQRHLPYVEAARILGLSRRRIMVRHIWPNIAPFIVANAFLDFAYGLVTLSALSFLGLGVGPGTADWGRMLAESRTLLFSNPAAALAPCAMLVLTAASMNVIGDRLFEWFSDLGRVR